MKKKKLKKKLKEYKKYKTSLVELCRILSRDCFVKSRGQGTIAEIAYEDGKRLTIYLPLPLGVKGATPKVFEEKRPTPPNP